MVFVRQIWFQYLKKSNIWAMQIVLLLKWVFFFISDTVQSIAERGIIFIFILRNIKKKWILCYLRKWRLSVKSSLNVTRIMFVQKCCHRSPRQNREKRALWICLLRCFIIWRKRSFIRIIIMYTTFLYLSRVHVLR